jgi:long-chain acyl-CoA synthetase
MASLSPTGFLSSDGVPDYSMTQDVRNEILSTLPQRLGDLCKKWLEKNESHPALVETGGTWTYKQLAEAIGETQTWLQASGVRPGDRVMVVGDNCRAFVALWFAVAGIDAWPVLINARIAAEELNKIREHCGARLILYTVGVSPQAAKHAAAHGAQILESKALGRVGISAVNQEAVPETLESDPADNIAVMIYTSGTTGEPKGVMLSHRNVLFMAAGSAKARSLTPNDRLIGVLPMSHAVGLSVVLLGTLISGGTLYIISRFEPAAMLQMLEREKITILMGNPSVFSLLVDHAKYKGIDSLRFPSLRVITSSGAPLGPAVKAQLQALFGMPLHNGYGVTECSPTIALTRPESPRSDISVGPPFPGIEIQLVDSNGAVVPENEVGELWVRGPNVMRGYYRAPEETRQAINPEGWFNTRDLAKLEEGNLFIVGRTKDLVVRFGFNVYPAEVEAVLNAHPAVVRSAVVGKTIAGEGGEELIAFIQKREEFELGSADLEKHATQHLTAYKRPSRFIFVADMPLTPTGKVIKDQLTRML